MKSIFEINKSVVFVKGALRGAIYNFNDGKVYSINEDGCKIIEEYITNHKLNVPYLVELQKMSLIKENFTPAEYLFPNIEKELNFVWLELTEACNLKCVHCYDGDEHKINASENLTFKQWKNILKQLKEVNCKKVEFIGGEPTVYPHFFELLQYSVSIGLSVEIYTNLQLFTNDLVTFISKNKIKVHFSIYGSKADVHDSVTGKPGSFDKTIFWLQELIKNEVVVIPAITIMRKNQEDYENILNLLKSLNVDLKLIALDTPRATDKRKVESLIPDNNKKYLPYRMKPNFTTNKTFFNMANSVNTCLFGKFSVQPNGKVSPCEFSRDIVLGNVKTSSIREILQSEKLNNFWFMDFSKIKECKSCEYRFACKDCRMITIKDNINSKNLRCLYNPLKGTWNN